MSRRASRRRAADSAPRIGSAVRGVDRTETWPDGDWVVRPVTGAAATKRYRCPGCDQEIHPATPHLVVWPAAGGVVGAVDGAGPDGRRHWHKPCWQARDRRGVRMQRSRDAPRHG